jgi:hypothetical protein
MAVTDGWNFSIVFEPFELEVSKTEDPDVVESGGFVLAAENVDIGALSGDCASNSRAWDIYMRCYVPLDSLSLPS